jgi:hypothetical protein
MQFDPDALTSSCLSTGCKNQFRQKPKREVGLLRTGMIPSPNSIAAGAIEDFPSLAADMLAA